MQSFEAAVLLRVPRLDPLWNDPQLDQVHRQAGKPSNGAGCKRRTVVAANSVRKPVLPKGGFQHPQHLLGVGVVHRLTAQQIPATSIAQRKRIDALTVAGSEVALEIQDRKSTRLNSSHMSISYAVFCLKKKKKKNKTHHRTHIR